jgi:Arc/MetJ-type ribon-helix-helix transcriptional regulator
MVRTQIQLTEKQAAALKRRARGARVSMAELIRQSVDRYLEQLGERDPEELRRRALAVAGRFRSGVGDLSEKHDQHLAEAYEE